MYWLKDILSINVGRLLVMNLLRQQRCIGLPSDNGIK